MSNCRMGHPPHLNHPHLSLPPSRGKRLIDALGRVMQRPPSEREMDSGFRRNDGGGARPFDKLRVSGRWLAQGERGWIPAFAGMTVGVAGMAVMQRPPSERKMDSGFRRNDGGGARPFDKLRVSGGWLAQGERGWIPAFAGMTVGVAGMTVGVAGMMNGVAGMAVMQRSPSRGKGEERCRLI